MIRRIDLLSSCRRFGFDGWGLGLAVLSGALGLGGCSSNVSSGSSTPQVMVSGPADVRLGSVRLWETDTAYAVYRAGTV